MKSRKDMVMKFLAGAASAAALCTLLVAATPTVAAAHDRDDNYAVQRWNREAPRYRTWNRYNREPDRDDYSAICDNDGDDCAPNRYYEGRYYQPAPAYNYNSYPIFRGWF
jgi:hypothetical protein